MRPQDSTPTPTRTPTPTPTPTRLTQRQENFCQSFVVYPIAANAARSAGYGSKSAKQQGYRLLKTDRIRARIREIHTALAADHGSDLKVLLGKLEVVYRHAIEDHHFYAAARAIELQAKLSGMAKSPPMIEGKAELPAAPEKNLPVSLKSVEM